MRIELQDVGSDHQYHMQYNIGEKWYPKLPILRARKSSSDQRVSSVEEG